MKPKKSAPAKHRHLILMLLLGLLMMLTVGAVVDAFLRLVDKGLMRDPDDHGGGSTESIENIRNGEKEN